MYRLEEFKNMTTTENYLKNYVDVKGFLTFCKACGCYGQVWSCPPYDFDPQEYWKIYKYIYIIGTKMTFEPDTADSEMGKEEAVQYMRREYHKVKDALSERMKELERRHPNGISLSAGNCNLCEKCTRPEGDACRRPDEIRYSIESLGGNVIKTAEELLGFGLVWSGGDLPEYMTLVNGFLTDDPNVEI